MVFIKYEKCEVNEPSIARDISSSWLKGKSTPNYPNVCKSRVTRLERPNHASRCDALPCITRLIGAQSRVARLILWPSRVMQKLLHTAIAVGVHFYILIISCVLMFRCCCTRSLPVPIRQVSLVVLCGTGVAVGASV